MPEAIRGQYQYFTQGAVENLRRAGYNAGFTPLEDGGRALRHRLSRSRRPLPVGTMFDFDKHLADLAAQTVLCIGDLMLDEFVYGEVSRISPEAPTPVIAVKRSEVMVGGAGNVARNIVALGARCIFVGVVGDDDAGNMLSARSAESMPRSSPIWWSIASRPTTRKVRFVSEHHSTHLLRADWEMAAPVDARDRGRADRPCARARCRASAPWCCPTMPRAC